MLLLFQRGIPEVFFPALEEYGAKIQQFPTEASLAHEVFHRHGEAEAIFFRANFRLADAELTLLPKLKLAALVSTGTDSVDTDALARRNVRLVTGEGANAGAVFDYVIQALLLGGYDPAKNSVGIIGAGRVGSKILKFLKAAGGATAYYDPFLPEPGSLADVLGCDYVSFHVPLTRSGPHPTSGMLDEKYFSAVQKSIHLVQTCRGEIWNKKFYESLAEHPRIGLLAQDVYPTEPPAVSDITRARYSTPHIAGYSTRGRLGGVVKGIRALFPDFAGEALYPDGSAWSLETEASAFVANPANFTQIRDNFPWRKEFSEFNAAERSAFRTRFPHIGDAFFSLLFREI